MAAGSPIEQPQRIFSQLNALLRTVELYPPAHVRIVQAKQTLHGDMTAFLDAHQRLEYRFLGDLLLANDRILPRESVVYRNLLDVCQNERGIGLMTFTQGFELWELDALLEALGQGLGGSLESWAARTAVTHVTLTPPIEAGKQAGEVAARRAYYGSVQALREIESTVQRQAPLSGEHIGALRLLTSTILDQIVQTPGLTLRLASIKSYDEYTLYHSVNVAVISIGLGLVIGLPVAMIREIAMTGMLHDLGKIAVPVEIVQKPGPLTEDEWIVMRRHPALGAQVLSHLAGSNRLAMIVAFEHHRRFDMTGYPLSPRAGPQHIVSRLACVADVYDAMTSRRVYKGATPRRQVCAYVREESGRIFDPRFIRILDHMVQWLSHHGEGEFIR